MQFLLWTTLLLSLAAVQGQDHCYADDTDPYFMFATTTPYDIVNDKSTNPVIVEGCVPKQLWLITRHGTRYADADEIKLLQDLPALRDKVVQHHEEEQKGSLCDKDLQNLKEWTLQVVTSLKSDLTPQGYKDLYDLAERLTIRYPTLLNQSASRDLFEVRFTAKQRTGASAFAFADGMFDTGMGLELPEPLDEDLIIKPYATCKKWEDEVDTNPDTLIELNKFDEGSIVTELLAAVSIRLGFDKSLTITEVKTMYDMCRFDKAWHLQRISPWCAVFTEEQLKVMEYREDLLLYYNKGYGHELNIKVGCPPLTDLIDHFSRIENGEFPQPAGVLYFTHSTMLQLFYSAFGIAKDAEPLTHTNYEQMRNRQWRTSNICPFATNLAAVFLQCDDWEPYWVQFYLNEHPLNIEGCEQGLCSWTYFKEQFGPISESCNLDWC